MMRFTRPYGARFHESYDTSLDEHVVYIGHHLMTDPVTIPGPAGDGTAAQTGKQGPTAPGSGFTTDIGRLLLSPTRTYAPLLRQLLTEQFDDTSWTHTL